MSKPAPNFLFIITDQQRFDWLGCNGHPVVKTPHIDALAANGTNFTRCHVASPVCMPNRASLMTGRYPSVHGLRYNGNALTPDAVTFADVLQQGGYQTATIGKSHLQPFSDVKPFARVDENSLGPLDEARFSDQTMHRQEEPARFAADELATFPDGYYGFQHVDLVTGHGDRPGGHYRQWLRQNYPNWEALIDRDNELPHNYSAPQTFRTPVPEEAYATSYIRDRAIDYIGAQQSNTAPFFAFVSFPDPHHPFNPPGKYWDMYDPDDFEVPLEYDAHHNPTPPMQSVRADQLDGIAPKTPQTVYMANKRHIQESMALTAGMITMVDDAVGAIVQQLKDTGQYDNTVIVFTSDHGDYLGDFSMMLKGALPFDGITHVPFIWSDPADRAPRLTNHLVSTIDLAPTIIARAGLKPYWGIQGHDISALAMGGDAAPVRTRHIVEYHDGLPRFGFAKPACVRALITDDYRLTLYKGEPFGDLYDLNADPQETHNRFDDPAYADIRAGLVQELADEMMAMMDPSPRSHRLA